MQRWWNRLRAWIGGREAVDHDLDEELLSHLDMETAGLMDRGLTPEQARLAARSRVGNLTTIAERSRDSWGFPSFESLLQDIRYGFRAMHRAPAFSLIVILTFALGVGVNTAIFSVVNTVLLKPLPFPAAERLVRLGEANAKSEFSVSWVNFNYWRTGNHTFEDMAGFQGADRTLTGRGDSISTHGQSVTAPFFSLLGMRPLMGRLLDASDDAPDAPATIVLSHRFWSSQLGGDPNIVGATLTLNGNPFEVVGVAAPQWMPWSADYYVSLGRLSSNTVDRAQHGSIRAIGRLKPGATLAAARSDLDAILRHLAETDPGPEADHHSAGNYLTEESVGDVRATLVILMSAAMLILLIACANVASLLLARNTARVGELALRRAIGAGQFRVVRQLLTENLVVALVGGAAGVGIAYWGLRALLAIAPKGIPRLTETTLDPQVLLFAIAITLVSAFVAAIAPVLVAGRVNLSSALKEGARTTGAGKQRQTFQTALVIAEVGITFMLAFGAGILLRSLIAAQTANPGFDARNLLSFSLSLPGKSYKSTSQTSQFYSGLLGDLRHLPGVAEVSAISCPPPAGDCGDWFYSIPGRPEPARDQVPVSLFNTAEAGYFHMMRIPIVAGREFSDTDRAAGTKVAIVNQKLAREWWPNESPVGRQIKVGGPYLEGALLQIVGVAHDVRQSGLDSAPMEEIYLPYAQQLSGDMAVMIRTSGDPAALMASVRATVRTLDRNLPLRKFGTMEESLGAELARRKFSTLLLTLFAVLAMSLAAVGIYGLLSYWVSSREPEIALRLALGARPSTILWWTSRHALRLALAGVLLGAGGAWISARFLEDLVFGVAARNPATMFAAAVAVIAIAFLAVAVPAARAARVDVAHRLHHG